MDYTDFGRKRLSRKGANMVKNNKNTEDDYENGRMGGDTYKEATERKGRNDEEL